MSDSGPNFATTSGHQATEAAERLAGLLDRIGDALVAVDTAALLPIEAELFGAVAALSAVTEVGDHTAFPAAALRARTSLLRCRRLGASFSGVARALGQVGRASEYDRSGGYSEGAGGDRPSLSVQIRA